MRQAFHGKLGDRAQVEYWSSMTSIEQTILQTLLELEAGVRSMPQAKPKPDLRPYFARIDALARQLPKDADASLLHYLHHRSYEKARLWLQGHDAENQAGSCRH